MTVVLDRVTKDRLQVSLEKHRTDPEYAPMIAEAKRRGYRLAEVWERQFLDPRDVYHWRGTLWVKLDA